MQTTEQVTTVLLLGLKVVVSGGSLKNDGVMSYWSVSVIQDFPLTYKCLKTVDILPPSPSYV